MSEHNLHRLLKADSIETKYLERICDLLDVKFDTFIDQKYLPKPTVKKARAGSSSSVAALEKKVAKLESAEQKWKEDARKYKQSNEEYQTQIKSLMGKLSGLQRKLNKLEQGSTPVRPKAKNVTTRKK